MPFSADVTADVVLLSLLLSVVLVLPVMVVLAVEAVELRSPVLLLLEVSDPKGGGGGGPGGEEDRSCTNCDSLRVLLPPESWLNRLSSACVSELVADVSELVTPARDSTPCANSDAVREPSPL